MKCSSCGAEIGDSKFCSYCGAQISSEMLREKEILNKEGCPKCGSTNISFNRENQGEIRGKNSKRIVHHTVGFCKDCGYTWRTDVGQTKKRKTWLWVLGWIFIFPLPVTLILLKKKEMKPILKYGIIALAWVLYLVIGFASNAANDTPAVIDQTQQTEQTQQTKTATGKYVLVGEELGEYGKKIVLNENTDMPVDKFLYKLPAGEYKVSTTKDKVASFFIVKDEIGREEGNSEYPDVLQYVGEGYRITAGDDDFNGTVKKSVTVTLHEDESFQLVGTDEFIFEKQEQ